MAFNLKHKLKEARYLANLVKKAQEGGESEKQALEKYQNDFLKMKQVIEDLPEQLDLISRESKVTKHRVLRDRDWDRRVVSWFTIWAESEGLSVDMNYGPEDDSDSKSKQTPWLWVNW